MAYSIDYYKQQYDEAKAKGDTAGMEAAHKAADAIRGYETTTTKDSLGNYVQTPVAATPSIPKTPTPVSGSESKNTVNVTRADGTKVQGTITDGKTTLLDGNSLKQGDVVVANGIKYTYDEAAGRGLTDQEIANKTSLTPTIQPTSDGTVAAGKEVEVIRADGTKVMGTVLNGKTTLSNGDSLKDGDSVTINGIKYVYDSSIGKGVADTSKTDSGLNPSIPIDQQGKQVTVTLASGKTRIGYIINGKTYFSDGSTLKQDDSVIANNGTRYTYVEALGRGLTDAEYTDYMGYPPPTQTGELNADTTLDELIALITNEVGADSPELQEFLSWAEAQAMASERYNPAYNQALEGALSNIDEKALKTGFYGQLPTEALKQQAIASAENEKYSAIMELAQSLINSSKEDAYNKLDVEMAQKENELNKLFSLLGIKQSEREYQDNKAQQDFENQLTVQKASSSGGSSSGKTIDPQQKVLDIIDRIDKTYGYTDENTGRYRLRDYNKAYTDILYLTQGMPDTDVRYLLKHFNLPTENLGVETSYVGGR